jgi:hypothetical protein
MPSLEREERLPAILEELPAEIACSEARGRRQRGFRTGTRRFKLIVFFCSVPVASLTHMEERMRGKIYDQCARAIE